MTDEIRKQIDGLQKHSVLLTRVLPTGFSQNYSADVVELSDVVELVEKLTNDYEEMLKDLGTSIKL